MKNDNLIFYVTGVVNKFLIKGNLISIEPYGQGESDFFVV